MECFEYGPTGLFTNMSMIDGEQWKGKKHNRDDQNSGILK
jgi:hypothetical protein